MKTDGTEQSNPEKEKQAKEDLMAVKSTSGSVTSQSFDKLGLFEVSGGDVVLRGRRKERDHVYPLEKLVKKYEETQYMLFSMARRGIRGWDTLADVVQDMRAKIVEAVEQRRKLNRSIPQSALDFAELHSNVKHTTIVVDK